MAPTRDGRLLAIDFEADFNTGAYASWGPTVANRVPVHASGPYVVPQLPRANARRSHQLRACRRLPRLRRAADGRCPGADAGHAGAQARHGRARLPHPQCAHRYDADRHRPGAWATASASAPASRRCGRIGAGAPRRRWPSTQGAAGASAVASGVAGMFYGCGNTSLPNPSTIRIGLKPDGRIALHQGAVDIGQGSNTVIAQIAADALGLPLACIDLVCARHRPHARLRQDLRLAPDLRHRQGGGTVPGVRCARAMLRLANAGEDARLDLRRWPAHRARGRR